MRPFMLRVGLHPRDTKLRDALAAYLRIITKLEHWHHTPSGMECLEEMRDQLVKVLDRDGIIFFEKRPPAQRQTVALLELAQEVMYQVITGQETLFAERDAGISSDFGLKMRFQT